MSQAVPELVKRETKPIPCRLCLSLSVHQTASISNSVVRGKLDIIFKFGISADDSLPSAVCSECIIKVDEFYSFHETVRINQSRLAENAGSNDNMILMVEIKADPCTSDGEEPEREDIYIQNVDTELEKHVSDNHDKASDTQNTAIESYDSDEHLVTKSDPEEPDNTTKIKNKSDKSMEDNLKIEQFFNGISCSLCPAVMQTFDQLKAHGKNKHGKNASILCCKREYFKKSLLIQHINTHLDPKHFYCEVCQKNYTSKFYLEVHMAKKHANPKVNRFHCSKCDKKFPRQFLLTAHLKTHVRVKCTVCDREMANAYSLNIHMQKIHAEGPRKIAPVHICDTCGRSFHQKQSLERHINLLHLGAIDTDRIQCPVCGKWVNKQYFKVHNRNAHSGENLQVTCSICQQIYPNKRALSTHKNKVHTKRNYKCEICNKMFKLPKTLKEHRAAHMDQRLYSCTVCNYTSNYNGNLYSHMKNKHPTEWAQVKANGGPLLMEQSSPVGMELD